MRACVLFFAGSIACGMSAAQSLNVDIDIGVGDQQGGNGAPSSAFGAAADSPGFWNRINALGPRNPVNLRGLDGGPTGVLMQGSGGLGVGGGYNSYSNTGDFALLLNDFAFIGGNPQEIDYHLTGLSEGRYRVFTYAVNASGYVIDTLVTVPGADDPLKVVTGPMPGNQFIEGVTHSVHDIWVTDGSIVIQVRGTGIESSVNGFQVVAVPEPSSLLAVTCGLPLLLRMRRRKR